MDFQNIKRWSIDSITRLIMICNDINVMRGSIDTSNRTLERVFTDSLNEDFDKDLEFLKSIGGVIERNSMKCVLFGKTSNGKSAVINAFLGEKILPSRMGRTTACFISVSGCDEDEGYFKFDNDNQKLNLRLLNEMSNQLSENQCDINSLLKVYWPKSKCRLLENDLEILDSPGIDYKEEHDDWITRYCEDVDIFILVVDGCGTLETSEKLFFKRITERISKPNIIVIVNKWDLVERDDNLKLATKQHLNDISKFLCDELKLYDENSVSNRIYFVSSLNELENKGTESFKEFKECLEMKMSRNAINTKFKPHVDNIRRVAFQIREVINKFLICSKIRFLDAKQVRYVIEDYIASSFHKILKKTKTLIIKNELYLKFQIDKVVSENRDFDDDTFDFLENDLAKESSLIFKKHIRKLENRIIEELSKRCYADANADQMKMYFTGENGFSSLHVKYEKCLLDDFEHFAPRIRNASKAKVKEKTRSTDAVKAMEITSRVLSSVATGVGPVCFAAGLALGGVAGASNLISRIIPIHSKEKIAQNMLFELMTFYTHSTNYVIEKFRKETSTRIKERINEYLKHQGQLLEFFKNLEDIREKINDQIEVITKENPFE